MENVQQRRSANNNNNKTGMKEYLPTERAGGGALSGSRGLTCVVRPAVGQTEGVGVAPCLLVFLEPAKNWGAKIRKYPPASPAPLPDQRCHTFSWFHGLAGGCRSSEISCEHIWSSCRSPGVQTRAASRVLFAESLGWSSTEHKGQVDLSCSKSLLHVLLTWSSCSWSLCLKFGFCWITGQWTQTLFFSGLEARWEGLKLCCCWTPEAKLSSGSLLWGQAWSQETEGSFPLLRKLFFFFFNH